jgi:hypothetical protein
MRTSLSILATGSALALVLFNTGIGIVRGASTTPPEQEEQLIVLVWPLIDGAVSKPEFHELERGELESAITAIVDKAASQWRELGLDQALIDPLVTDCRLLLSAIVRGDFETYDKLLSDRGAKLTTASGLSKQFADTFEPIVSAAEWEEMSPRERFALIWSKPGARRASWRKVENIVGGLALREPAEQPELWRVFQRSAWQLPDGDRMAHKSINGERITTASIKMRITFTERVGDVRFVFIYDDVKEVWFPYLVDIIGVPRYTQVLF